MIITFHQSAFHQRAHCLFLIPQSITEEGTLSEISEQEKEF